MASAEEKDFDDINVTPMVDLYLVLLLIFIIMTTAGVQGVKVNLPSANSKPATQKLDMPKTQAVTIDPSGNLKLNTTPVTLADLESRLTAIKAATPDVPVVLHGQRQPLGAGFNRQELHALANTAGAFCTPNKMPPVTRDRPNSKCQPSGSPKNTTAPKADKPGTKEVIMVERTGP